MFREAENAISEGLDPVDVCVVGAGVAGLVIARRLEKSGLQTLLLESGGRTVEDTPQSLNGGVSNLQDYPFTTSRFRAFGGSSTRWVGACIPLDQYDFEVRDWLEHSGWPIGWQDIQPFYEATRQDFGLPEVSQYQRDLEATPFHGGDLESKVVLYSQPLDLGERYGELIARSTAITCLLHATATEIFPDPVGSTVDRIEIAAPSGRRGAVQARHVILAGGGIENARLLLASNSIQPQGLGNSRGALGRYHMEHPMRAVAVLPTNDLAKDVVKFTNRDPVGNCEVQGTFGLSRDRRKRERLLDMHLRAFRFNELEDTRSVVALKALQNRILGKGVDARDGSAENEIWRILHPRTVRYVGWHLSNKLMRSARFDHVRFTAFVEQEPDPENRISLSDTKDRFGRPLPRLQYRESELMSDSIHRTLVCLGSALKKRGFGALRHGASLRHLAHYDEYGLHQMGATRMSEDASHGVVDRNCRVHGLSNLYVAGSSVFPTGGAANPTWTIAALALRLADHLTRLGTDVVARHLLPDPVKSDEVLAPDLLSEDE